LLCSGQSLNGERLSERNQTGNSGSDKGPSQGWDRASPPRSRKRPATPQRPASARTASSQPWRQTPDAGPRAEGGTPHYFCSTEYNETWRRPAGCQAAGEHALLGTADIQGSPPPPAPSLHPASGSYAWILTKPARRDASF